MSRSGYDDCLGSWELIMYRGQVASATRGKRGQRMLVELLAALDAMPIKRLITGLLVEDGEVCALGALGQARGVDMDALDIDESQVPEALSGAFDIARQLAAEVVFQNDEHWHHETPEQRWTRMRAWTHSQIRKEAAQPGLTE